MEFNIIKAKILIDNPEGAHCHRFLRGEESALPILIFFNIRFVGSHVRFAPSPLV